MNMMFHNQQKTGCFEYDATSLDLNQRIKNLKHSTLELTEKVYVDKPMKKQKELPIERKQGMVQTLV